jgi:hypothetical protein
MSAIKHLLDFWWVPALTLLAVSVWGPARRLAKLNALERKNQRHYPRELNTKAPFRRHDFAAKAAIVRKERMRGTAIAMVILLLWYPSLIAISRLLPSLPHGWLTAYQAILFVAAMGSYLTFIARGSRLARRSGLICPACGMELVGIRQRAGRPQDLIQDLVLETGKCPGCKKQLLDPAEVGPVENLGPDDTVLYAGACVALVAGIVVMLYFGTAQVDPNAWTRCRRLYARSYTASDSILIDSTVAPRNHVTCEYFRRNNNP